MNNSLKRVAIIAKDALASGPLSALWRRSLLAAALAFTLGLWLGLRLPPPWGSAWEPWLWLFAGICAFAAIAAQWQGNTRRTALLLVLAALAAGLARSQPLNRRLALPYQESKSGLWIEGRVLRDLGVNASSRRHGLLLDRVVTVDLEKDPQVRSAWEGRLRVSYDVGRSGERKLNLAPGDRIGFAGTLWHTHPPTNPGEFDYRSFQLGRGITANAAPHSKANVEYLRKEGGLVLQRAAFAAQQKLAGAFDRHLSPVMAALARGAILGDKSNLERRDVKAFTRSGLAYLLAVSGLHLALSMILFMALATRLSANRRVQAVVALALVLGYALVTGLQVPAQRAACLFALVLLARALDFETDFAVSLAFGALVVLGLQPAALWEAGFQLSFLVTASIVYVGRGLSERLAIWMPLRLAQFFGVVWSAQVAVIPLTAYHFNQFTWPALVSDGSVAWAMPLIIALGLICGLADLVSATLASWIAFPLEWCLRWLYQANHFFSELPGAVLSSGRASAWLVFAWIGFAGALAVWLLPLNGRAAPRQVRGRPAVSLAVGWGGLVVLVAWTLWPAMPWNHRHAGETRVWFLDVGQGDATLMEFEDGRTALMDVGPNRPDAGSWVVEPALRALGISKVDLVLLSHPHADHVGGLLWLAQQVPVGEVWHSGWDYKSGIWNRVQAELKARDIPLRVPNNNDTLKPWSDRMELLSPGTRPMRGTKHDMHNNGLAVLVEGWLWLGGDMGVEGERRLLRQGKVRDIEVLKAGHHGSRTSGDAAFLAAAKPEAVVVSCGRREMYGHPHQEALAAVRSVGSALWRTDQQGCLTMRRRKRDWVMAPYRAPDAARHWDPGARRTRVAWKKLGESGAIETALATARKPL